MTDKHYCEEHQTKFFKTAKMRGYAHPIGDTGKWCNEGDQETYHSPDPDAKEVAKLPPRKVESPPLATGEEPMKKTREQEIAEHVWWKELGSMIRAGDVDMTKPAGKLMRTAYYTKMMSVLDLNVENK